MAAALVPVEKAGLLESGAEMGRVHLRVNVSIDHQQIGETIVVHVGKGCAPA